MWYLVFWEKLIIMKLFGCSGRIADHSGTSDHEIKPGQDFYSSLLQIT
jgi:hypothetical protein